MNKLDRGSAPDAGSVARGGPYAPLRSLAGARCAPGNRITVRTGDRSHARRLHALIAANREEGHLLPRTFGDVAARANRFAVAFRGRKIVGCAELAPLSPLVAEVRSLAVAPSARNLGVGGMLVEELRQRARREGFEKLCAFTHAPGYFMQMGFSIVPHLWLPEKIFADCVKCPQFRRCGQFAMIVPLDAVTEVSDREPTTFALRLA